MAAVSGMADGGVTIFVIELVLTDPRQMHNKRNTYLKQKKNKLNNKISGCDFRGYWIRFYVVFVWFSL